MRPDKPKKIIKGRTMAKKKTTIAEFATPEIQAEALLRLETTIRNQIANVREKVQEAFDMKDEKARNKRLSQLWLDVYVAHMLPEPEQVIQLLKRLEKETGEDGKPILELRGEKFCEKFKTFLEKVRNKNTLEDLKDGIFYVPKEL